MKKTTCLYFIVKRSKHIIIKGNKMPCIAPCIYLAANINTATKNITKCK